MKDKQYRTATRWPWLLTTVGCLIQVTNTAFVLSKNSDFETGCLIDGGH